jgi:hypothetical protein
MVDDDSVLYFTCLHTLYTYIYILLAAPLLSILCHTYTNLYIFLTYCKEKAFPLL